MAGLSDCCCRAFHNSCLLGSVRSENAELKSVTPLYCLFRRDFFEFLAELWLCSDRRGDFGDLVGIFVWRRDWDDRGDLADLLERRREADLRGIVLCWCMKMKRSVLRILLQVCLAKK